MTDRAYRRWLAVLYVAGVALLAYPIVVFMMNPAYTGLLPVRSPDEGHYLVRLQAHLLHPFLLGVPDGVWTVPNAPEWLQVSWLEYGLGTLFGWTGTNAAAVGWWSMALIAPLCIVLTSLLSRRAGASRGLSLVLGVVFFILLHALKRMFHPSISFPLTELALLWLWIWWDSPRALTGFIAGALAGALFGVYLWSWMVVWGTAGFLGVLLAVDSIRDRGQKARFHHQKWQTLAWVFLGFALAAAPSILASLSAQASPFFAESSDRMGLLLSHELESPMRSLLLLLITVSAFVAIRTPEDRRRFAPLLAMQCAVLLAFNQQLIHGRVMSFSSHTFSLACLAALLLLAFVLSRPRQQVATVMLGVLACVPLLAAAHDYSLLGGILGDPQDDGTMHLGAAMQELQGGSGTVLTDGFTGNAVGAVTDRSVVFIEYSRILLIPTSEYIERYCLSEALTSGAIDTRWPAEFQEEKSRVGRQHTAELFQKHLKLAQDICPRVRKNLKAELQKFGVTTVLWNERLKPDWKIPSSMFMLVTKGEGWSLWEVTAPSSFPNSPAPEPSSR